MTTASRHNSVHLTVWPLVLLLPLAMLTGCDDDGEEPDTSVATPTTFEECNHGPDIHGEMAFALKAHWKGGRYGYGEGADLFVCLLNPVTRSEVKIVGPAGVNVTPPRAKLTSGQGIVWFEVQATQGASGQLTANYTFDGGYGSVTGPQVASDEDGWTFSE